ncbi:putative calcium-transporting ATPase [Rosa chinensis]|uniref:Putative calcium-transporting ATPase n=1 Tax=Rosa chinensis TaxID=74649 RepID=A0A2P6PP18_ROSCH|nr:putative calcium-transporting ATPase [Rosa chinensis]
MVTGDHFLTAKAIALECGIISDKDTTEPNIIEGKTFHELSEKEREECANNIKVMWRSYPNDKLLLVQALRKGAYVVAVTGDDTNDAPALHEAISGLSMGIQGTDVAKESSDIIILDDNFASVVKVRKVSFTFTRSYPKSWYLSFLFYCCASVLFSQQLVTFAFSFINIKWM